MPRKTFPVQWACLKFEGPSERMYNTRKSKKAKVEYPKGGAHHGGGVCQIPDTRLFLLLASVQLRFVCVCRHVH